MFFSAFWFFGAPPFGSLIRNHVFPQLFHLWCQLMGGRQREKKRYRLWIYYLAALTPSNEEEVFVFLQSFGSCSLLLLATVAAATIAIGYLGVYGMREWRKRSKPFYTPGMLPFSLNFKGSFSGSSSQKLRAFPASFSVSLTVLISRFEAALDLGWGWELLEEKEMLSWQCFEFSFPPYFFSDPQIAAVSKFYSVHLERKGIVCLIHLTQNWTSIMFSENLCSGYILFIRY